ncbi:MAG: hypothetical protein EP338_09405 [Bacteroidetes bacterium]|nr:MAG: hypothetical protein EP338_09405 [Bacteroidota bacterium]
MNRIATHIYPLILFCASILLLSFSGTTQFNPSRYDSIKQLDSNIRTAYKKQKVFYLNQLGKKMARGKLGSTLFSHGQGALVKRRKIFVVDSLGSVVSKYSDDYQFRQFQSVLYISPKDNDLGSDEQMSGRYPRSDKGIHRHLFIKGEELFENTIDTVFLQRHLLMVRVKEHGSSPSVVPIHFADGEIIPGDFSLLERRDDLLLIHEKYNKEFTTYFPNHDRWYNDIVSYDSIEKNHLALRRKHETLLLNALTAELLLTTWKESTFDIRKHTIFVLSEAGPKEHPHLRIHDLSGQLLADKLHYVRDLDSNRVVLQKDELMYISALNGKALSKSYRAIGEDTNGYRVVYEGSHYSFINDSTYEQVPFSYPVIAIREGDLPSKSNFLQELFRAFLKLTTWPLAIINSGYREALYGDNSKDLVILEPSSGFHDGLARVCLIAPQHRADSASLIITSLDQLNAFNYVDIHGKLLNDQKYLNCIPFRKGLAWVKSKKKKGVFQIDTQGKRIGAKKYDDFEVVEHQFVKVKKLIWVDGWFSDYWDTIDGLYDPDGNKIFDCRCDAVLFKKEENKFICSKDDRRIKEFLLPNPND